MQLQNLSSQYYLISIASFLIRSSHQRCSLGKGVLGNFAKFTGKHLCQSLFFNKVAGLRPKTLLKKGVWNRCFPMNFDKFLRTPFFVEHLLFFLFLFFYLGFLSQPFTNHRTTREGSGHFFNSSLLIPPTSRTLKH